ncbi:MAG: type I methionyl aminopeptidase [Treponemataceae bacterium]|nr:MAG: type I methionyl aminopeptidase [Treponemataceae bacterium]
MIRLKNDTQIAGIRKSCRLLAELYKKLIPQIKPGITTLDISNFCHDYMLKAGGKPAWFRENFPAATCVSVNNEVIHGIPKKRKINDGDIVSVDVGIDLNGYISDSAISVIAGRASPAATALVEITKKCLDAGIAACVAGNRIGDISRAVFETARGYGVVHEYCGHGVGLDVHEDPSIPNVPGRSSNTRIQSGMVLAIEPMINIGTADVELLADGWTVVTADGSLSAHEEHTVAVFADHTEVLTLRD